MRRPDCEHSLILSEPGAPHILDRRPQLQQPRFLGFFVFFFLRLLAPPSPYVGPSLSTL